MTWSAAIAGRFGNAVIAMNQAWNTKFRIDRLGVEIARLVRFGVVGILSAAVYAVVTFAINALALGSPIMATICGHVAAGAISYLGHLHFSFGVPPQHRTFLSRFLLVAAATFAVNIFVTWLLVDVLGLSYLVAIAVVTALIPTTNYLFNRFWVFLPGLDVPPTIPRGEL